MLLGTPDNPGLVVVVVVVVAPGGFGDDDELLLPPASGNVDLRGVIGLSRPFERPSSLNVLPLPSLELHIELSESELDAAAAAAAAAAGAEPLWIVGVCINVVVGVGVVACC